MKKNYDWIVLVFALGILGALIWAWTIDLGAKNDARQWFEAQKELIREDAPVAMIATLAPCRADSTIAHFVGDGGEEHNYVDLMMVQSIYYDEGEPVTLIYGHENSERIFLNEADRHVLLHRFGRVKDMRLTK